MAVTGAGRRCSAASMPRTSGPAMLEAFDLLPVVDCLKLETMDAVQVCMDKLEPWMELTEGGGLSFSLNAVNGFIGGSVGVLGTVAAAQIKKAEVKNRLKCVYCEGSGQIGCGHCFVTGVYSYSNPDGSLTLGARCDNCESTGSVVCINCQGSGLSVPEDFLQVLGDEEMGFTEADYIGLFDGSATRGEQPAASAAPAAAAPSGESQGADESTRS